VPGSAEVGNDEAIGGKKEVGGLDISVDDVFAVEVCEACEEVVKEGEELWRGGKSEGSGEGEGVVGEGEDEVGIGVVERGDKRDDVGVRE
jgi:hypothetical protein